MGDHTRAHGGCLPSEGPQADAIDARAEAVGSIYSSQRQRGGSSAVPHRGWAHTAQQQRRYAQLCTRLLQVLERRCNTQRENQQQQQMQQQQLQQEHRVNGYLASLAHRARACAEAGDSRGATAAVSAFLREYGVALGVMFASHMQQKADDATESDRTEAARDVLLLLTAHCRCSTAANSAELMVQRQVLGCAAAVFRAAPQLAAPGSAAVGEALAAAAAAAVALHRVLGSEPRPRTDRGLQRYLKQQQQQQHFLALGMAAAQPKHVALIRALLLSIHSLLGELARARSARTAAAASGRGLCIAADAAGPRTSALAPLGAEGESSVELLLLLLPLALAQPVASAALQQLRNTAATSGWGPSCGLTTDFASTQESDLDGSKRRGSPAAASAAASSSAGVGTPPGVIWRRGPALCPVGSCVPLRASCSEEEAPSAALDRGPHTSSVRLECLRCVEGLLRLCGRELLPYWGLLLRYKRPSLLVAPAPSWNAAGCRLLRSAASSAAAGAATDPQRGGALPLPPRTTAAASAAASAAAVAAAAAAGEADEWLRQLLGLERTEQLELQWSSLVISKENPKVCRAAVSCVCALLEAPPLRQWPAPSSACARCGPEALLLRSKDWEHLLGPLGFAGEGPCKGGVLCRGLRVAGRTHSSRSAAAPAGGLGAFTSLSHTVRQVSRCALACLLGVVRCGLTEDTVAGGGFSLNPGIGAEGEAAPKETAAAASSRPLAAEATDGAAAHTAARADADASPATTAAVPADAAAEDGALWQHSSCIPPGSTVHTPLTPEKNSASSQVVVALRGLAESLPALPVGLLEPGISAAALRLVHPLVLLLAETLDAKLQQLLLLPQQQELACYFCSGNKATENAGPECTILAESAASVAQRSHAAAAVATATAASAVGAAAAGTIAGGPSSIHPDKGMGFGIYGTAAKRLQFTGTPQHDEDTTQHGADTPRHACFAHDGFEAFTGQVLARGPHALRLVVPALGMIAAVVGGKERQPQIAEALLAPVGRGARVAGPSCLAWLLCKALHALLSLRSNPAASPGPPAMERGFGPGFAGAGGGGPQSVHQETRCGGGSTAEGLQAGPSPASRCSCDALSTATAACSGWAVAAAGEGEKGPCSNCERQVQAIFGGMFATLQATSRQYPQVLLLLLDCDDGSLVATCAAACLPRDTEGPFLAMLRSLLSAPCMSLRCRGVQLALDVLCVASQAPLKDVRGAVPPEPMPCGGLSPGSPCGPLQGPHSDYPLHRSRAALVALLKSHLITPLLAGMLSTISKQQQGQQEQQQQQKQQQQRGQQQHPELLVSASVFLCRLTSEEWQRCRLLSPDVLEVLRVLVASERPRNVRVAAATAVGAFAAQTQIAQQQQQQQSPATPSEDEEEAADKTTNAAQDTALAQQHHIVGEDTLLREALQLLLLQLEDPIHDMRTAVLGALCEAAGAVQQHQRQQQQSEEMKQQRGKPSHCITVVGGDLWVDVLKGINDVLEQQQQQQQVNSYSAAAVGLRAIGAVAPLVLLLSDGEPAGPLEAEEGVDSGCKGTPEGACLGAGARKTGANTACKRTPFDELRRSLAVLAAVLLSASGEEKGETSGPHTQPCRGLQQDAAARQRESSCCREGDASQTNTSGAPIRSQPPGAVAIAGAAGGGLRQLKLQWNACNSIRLLFSAPAASRLFTKECIKFFLPLWRGVCLCLRASHLTKVRSHAAAALEAMLQFVAPDPAEEMQLEFSSSLDTLQLRCTCFVAPLLTEAWEALTAAAAETGTKGHTHIGSSGCGEERRRVGRSAPPPRRQECLRSQLQELMEGSLIQRTQRLLAASEASLAGALNPVQTGAPSQPLPCSSVVQTATAERTRNCCCSQERAGSPAVFAALEALRRATEAGLQDRGLLGATQLQRKDVFM